MEPDGRRIRVLIVAEAANPEWVSVPLVGWSLAAALRKITAAHIVTHVRNREAFLRAGLVEGIDFTAIDSERIAAPLWKIAERLRGGGGRGWTVLSVISTVSYYYFEVLVWRKFSRDIKAGAYDIVHRVTPLSPTTPSIMARKCRAAGVPFILGPLNGGVPWPRLFDATRRAEGEWLSYVRGLFKLLPGLRATYRSAALVIAGSRFTASEIATIADVKVHYIPENGIDPARFNWRPRPQGGHVLRICFIGRLVPYKGPDMLLEAVAALARANLLRLDIIGDGPMLEDLKALAMRLAIQNQVTFHGWITHEEIADIAGESSVFGFPSIREFGGGAVIEAMALGLVPIVVDYAGPGELVNSTVGYKVALGDRRSIVADLKATIEAASKNPAEIQALGKAAHDYVMQWFTWDNKAELVRSLYEEAIAGKTPIAATTPTAGRASATR